MNPRPDTRQPRESKAAAENRPLYWSVRRELWENRFVTIAPLVVTAFVLLGSMIALIGLPGRVRSLPAGDPEKLQALAEPFRMAPAPIMLACLLVGAWYCLDALYGERRDRSILFWKSLPVSDVTTVLSKALVPLVVLPLIAFLLSVATQVTMLLAATAGLLLSGVSPAPVWSELRFFQGLVIMLYGLTVHALWFSPIYGWLLLVSAWARRAPFLWAVLPLLSAAAVEWISVNTSYFASLLGYRLGGAMREAFVLEPGSGVDGDFSRLSQLDPLRFVSSPGLWTGLLFAAVFLAAAVWLRRRREPI